MIEMVQPGATLVRDDFGDAIMETKQYAPTPPYYFDWLYTYGPYPSALSE